MPGILNQLPPGLAGYVAAEQMAQQRAQQNFGQIQGVLGLQGMLEQQRQAAQLHPIQAQIAQAQLDAMRAPPRDMVVPAGASLVGPGGAVRYTAPMKEPPASELGKLIAERDALPPGDMRRKPYDDKIRLLTTREPVQKVPMGYRLTAAGELEPIPGGPADFRQQGIYNADTAARQSTESNLDRMIEEAKALKAHSGLGGITGLTGAFPNWPGGDAAGAKARLETLKSQTGINTIQAMRDASKTGGAVGQVTEKEWPILQNNIAALDQAQSTEEFQAALDRIVKFAEGAKLRISNAYNMKYNNRGSRASDNPDIRDDPLNLRGGR